MRHPEQQVCSCATQADQNVALQPYTASAPSRGVVSQFCSSVISGWPGIVAIALGSPSSFAVMESSCTCRIAVKM